MESWAVTPRTAMRQTQHSHAHTDKQEAICTGSSNKQTLV